MVTEKTPRIEQGQPLQLAGFHRWYAYADAMSIPQLWEQLNPLFGEIPHQVGFVAYGVIYTMGADGFDYMAGAEVSAVDGLPEGFETLTLPARTYAVFPHAGHVSALRETMDFAWNDWIPKSGYVRETAANGTSDYFERYDEDFDPAQPGHVELWVPVKK